jgi:hypothetical protein
MELKRRFAEPIEAAVEYSLADYYRAVADHAPQALKESGKSGPVWFMRNIVPLIACVVAVSTKKLKPQYHFTISNEGIVRRSDAGELVKPWSDVNRIRVYSQSYLVEVKEGAMVLPYRAFTAKQQSQLREAFG